jgi:DNA mismatch endonuclease (patch repair protein)
VDGCFWHGCPEHRAPSRTHPEYWTDKIAVNRARDDDTNRRLTALGWKVLRIWEHEDIVAAANRVEIEIRGALSLDPPIE